MKYAVIKSGAKQYRVEEEDEILIEKIEGKAGDTHSFTQVLLYVDGKEVKFGQPYLEKYQVKGTLVEHLKDKKIRVATYKAKSRTRRVKGHRQQLTKVKIGKISSSGKVTDKSLSKKATKNKKAE